MKSTLLLSLGLATFALTATTTFAGEGCSASKATAASYGQKDIIQTAVGAGQFNTLATALTSAGLVDALQGEGPFTVFAPTDAAFAMLPEGTVQALLKPENRDQLTTILTYHVVAGRVPASKVVGLRSAQALNGQRFAIATGDDGVRVAGVQVVKTDIECSNGIIHVVDAVMMPATKNIVETASGAGSFRTLVAAVGAAGLADALQSKGPFTVFAPTDEAFAALPKGTVESLLKPENRDQLVAILKYHVVAGRVYSDQLSNGSAETLPGSSVDVMVSERGVKIGNSNVVKADIETTNGVIHVIDTVLLPR